MLGALLVGIVAGYAIAIPVGPVALLILRTGMQRGLATAAAAGAGTATADLVYATIAMLFGAAASDAVAPILPFTRVVAAVVLALIAVRVMVATPRGEAADAPRGGRGTYLSFLGLTLLNPPTIVYFVSLAMALPQIAQEPASRALFVVGAFASSLSWQELLAVGGALLHGRLTPRVQRFTAVTSGVIILALAARIAFA